MNATGVLSAQPVAASGAVRVGRRSMAGLGRSTVGAFHGNTRQLKARAVMGRRAAMPMGIRAEKVVGIDLGTTNSAVRPRARAPPRVSARPSLSGVSRRSTRRGIRARFLQGSGFRFGAASRSRRARTRPRSGRPPRARARRASRGIRRAIRGARRSEPSPCTLFIHLDYCCPPPPTFPRILTSAAPIRPPARAASQVAAMEGGSPTIVTNSEGGRTTPSVVAYAKNGDRLVGQVRPRPISTSRRALSAPRAPKVAESALLRCSNLRHPSRRLPRRPARVPRTRAGRRVRGTRAERRHPRPSPATHPALVVARPPAPAPPPRTDRRGDVDDRARRRATPPSGRGERFSFPADRARAPLPPSLARPPPSLARSRRHR